MSKQGIIFRVAGGFGKNIVATAIASQIKKANKGIPLHVQASYPDAFANLDFVDAYYPLQNTPYFYEPHKDFEIVEAEPYIDLEYRQGVTHMIEAWCRRCGVNAPENMRGILHMTKKEKATAEAMLSQLKAQAQDRKIIAVQFTGGTSFYDPDQAGDPSRFNQVRDLPLEKAQEIVNELNKRGYLVVQISLPREPRLEHTFWLGDQNTGQPFHIRAVLAVLEQVDGLICIDSFAQHAWTALGKSGAVVLWGATNPKNLGYETNTNLAPPANTCSTPHCNRPCFHVSDYVGNNQPWQCPIDGKCMEEYNAEEVVNALEKAQPAKSDKVKPLRAKRSAKQNASSEEETKE